MWLHKNCQIYFNWKTCWSTNSREKHTNLKLHVSSDSRSLIISSIWKLKIVGFFKNLLDWFLCFSCFFLTKCVADDFHWEHVWQTFPRKLGLPLKVSKEIFSCYIQYVQWNNQKKKKKTLMDLKGALGSVRNRKNYKKSSKTAKAKRNWTKTENHMQNLQNW